MPPEESGRTVPDDRVLVVVAAYEAERWIRATLASVLAQTHAGWRCVVVDDGSSDGTAEAVEKIAAQDARVELVRQRNRGASAARNVGLAHARGEPFLAVVDADDLLLPHALARHVGALTTDPRAVGVTSLAEYVDEAGGPVRAGEHPAIQRRRRTVSGRGLASTGYGGRTTSAQLVLGTPMWPPASMLLRADAVRQVGGWREDLGSQEDWDLHVRLARRGDFLELDEQTALYRVRAGSLTGDRRLTARSQAVVRRSGWETARDTSERRAWAFAHRHVHRGHVRVQWRGLRAAALRRDPAGAGGRAALLGWYAVLAAAARPPVPRRAVLRLTAAAASLDQRLSWRDHGPGTGPA